MADENHWVEDSDSDPDEEPTLDQYAAARRLPAGNRFTGGLGTLAGKARRGAGALYQKSKKALGRGGVVAAPGNAATAATGTSARVAKTAVDHLANLIKQFGFEDVKAAFDAAEKGTAYAVSGVSAAVGTGEHAASMALSAAGSAAALSTGAVARLPVPGSGVPAAVVGGAVGAVDGANEAAVGIANGGLGTATSLPFRVAGSGVDTAEGAADSAFDAADATLGVPPAAVAAAVSVPAKVLPVGEPYDSDGTDDGCRD